MPKNYFKKLFKAFIYLLLSIACSMSIVLIGSILILNTGLSEDCIPLISSIAICVGCITLNLMFVFNFKLKGIVCSLITFSIYLILKIIATLSTIGELSFSLSNSISIIIMFIFCFVGALVGSGIKK